MKNLRALLGIRRMDRVLNTHIWELCGVMKGVREKIDEDVLQWFSHVERMERHRIAKRVYIRECAYSHSVGMLQKSWTDTMKVSLRKIGLDVRQAMGIVQDRSGWWWFVRGNALGLGPKDETQTLTTCHSCGLTQL